jgi:oxepin-CoA hydrolase/3-oxo-5,6-dehydrosuberyl-CoA semialdehyde dehydrogenase
MAAQNLNREMLPWFIERVAKLRADTPRQWGTMDAARMVQHLIFMTETSLGMHEVPDRSTPIVRKMGWWLVFCLFTTWPKGRYKSFDFQMPAPAGEFPVQQAALIRLMECFVAELEATPERKTLSPLLGMITLKQWSRVHGVHNAHHLRQFGV